MLGAIVVTIFDSSTFTEAGVNLEDSAIAFLAGLGVKVVYGAIERTVETLASKLNLDALRKARPPRAAAPARRAPGEPTPDEIK